MYMYNAQGQNTPRHGEEEKEKEEEKGEGGGHSDQRIDSSSRIVGNRNRNNSWNELFRAAARATQRENAGGLKYDLTLVSETSAQYISMQRWE